MTQPTMTRPTMSRPTRATMLTLVTSRWAACAATLLSVTMLAVAAWLRAEDPGEDRGSDATEKAFNIILAIAVGTAVSVAAVAFVTTKTALFK